LARRRVLADFKTLARDVEGLLKVTAGDLRENVKLARAQLASTMEQTTAAYREMEERSVAQGKAAAVWADTMIRKHPYECLGTAFGLGVLVGVLIARK
jgi:ElaB/YqjD/DUF883 family membrane-anchored ribosome-binding protein